MTPDQRLSLALTRRLHATGVLSDDDVGAMADEMERDCAELALLLRCIVLRSHEPSATDWQADRARRRFSVIDGGES